MAGKKESQQGDLNLRVIALISHLTHPLIEKTALFRYIKCD
jgi:hypothetical protein